MVEKRYHALRVIATIYKVVGVILGVLVVLAVLGICLNLVLGTGDLALFESGRPRSWPGLFPWWSWHSSLAMPRALGGVIMAVFVLVGGGLNALTFYGLGELITLLLALEENTRATAAALQQQRG